jgi:hypothetical protein
MDHGPINILPYVLLVNPYSDRRNFFFFFQKVQPVITDLTRLKTAVQYEFQKCGLPIVVSQFRITCVDINIFLTRKS